MKHIFVVSVVVCFVVSALCLCLFAFCSAQLPLLCCCCCCFVSASECMCVCVSMLRSVCVYCLYYLLFASNSNNKKLYFCCCQLLSARVCECMCCSALCAREKESSVLCVVLCLLLSSHSGTMCGKELINFFI